MGQVQKTRAGYRNRNWYEVGGAEHVTGTGSVAESEEQSLLTGTGSVAESEEQST